MDSLSQNAVTARIDNRIDVEFLKSASDVDIHLIQKRLSSELLHCALRIVVYPDRKAPWM